MRKSKKIGAKIISGVLVAGMMIQNAAAYVNVINSYTPPSPDFGSGSVYNITLSNTSDKESTNVNFTHALPDGLKINGNGSVQSSCGNVTVENTGNNGVIKLTNGKIRGMVNGINGSCTITVNVLADKVGTFVSTFRVGDITAVTNGINETNRDASSATLVQTIKNMNISIFGTGYGNMNKGEQKEITVRLQNLNNKALTNVSFNSIQINDAFRVVPNSGSSTCGGTVNTNNGTSVSASGMNIGINQTCEVKFKIEAVTTQDADNVFTKIIRTFGTLSATSVTSDQGSVIDHDVESNSMQVYAGVTTTQEFNEGTTPSGANISKAPGQDKDTDITFTFRNNDINQKTGVAFRNNFSAATGNAGTIKFKEVVENTCGGNITGQGTSSIDFAGMTVPGATPNVDGMGSGECKVVARLTVNNIGTYHSTVDRQYEYLNSFNDGDKAGSLYTKYDRLSLNVNEPGEIGITKTYVPLTERDKKVGIYVFGDESKYKYTITNLSNQTVTDINFADYYSEKRGNTAGTIVSEDENFRIKDFTTTCGGTKTNATDLKLANPYVKGHIDAKVSGFSLQPGQSCDIELTVQTNINQEPSDRNGVDRQKDFARFDWNHTTIGAGINYTVAGQRKTLVGNNNVTVYSGKFPLKVSEYYNTTELAGANSYIDVIVNKRGEYELRNFDHKVELHEGFTLLSKDIEYLPNENENVAGTCEQHSKTYTIEGNIGDNTFRLKNNSIAATDTNENLTNANISDARHVSLCKMRIKVKVPKIETENKTIAGVGTNPAQDFGSIYKTADAPVGVRVSDIDEGNARHTLNKLMYHRSNVNIVRSELVANKSFTPERIKGGEKSLMKITLQNDFGTSENVINGTYTENFANTRIQLHPEANPQVNAIKGVCEGIKFTQSEDRTSIKFEGLNMTKGSVCEISFNITGKLEGNVISPIRQGDFSSENGPYNTNNAEATIQIEPSVFVYEKFDVPQINTGEKTNLNVEIFNTKKDPAMETITSFANVLPKGLEATRQISNTCGGNVEITKNGEGLSVITLTNGNNLPAGGSCKIVTEVTGMPGNYLDTIAIGDVNTASNVPNYNATEAPLTIVGKVTTVYKDKKCENNDNCGIPEIAPRCEGTQACDPVDVPPYRTPTVPPTCVPTNDGVLCTHYYDKPKVITSYKDKSCEGKETCEIPDLAQKCEGDVVCAVKDIPPYITPNTPPVCVDKGNETHCDYYYEKPPVVTTYKDKICEGKETCEVPDLAPKCENKTTNCEVKDIPPYTTPKNPPVCIDVPFNGSTVTKQKVCTYYYEPPIVTEYKDKKCENNDNCGIPDLAPKCTNEAICPVKDIPPYITPKNPPVCKEVPFNGNSKQKVCTYYYDKPPVTTIYKDKICEGKENCEVPEIAPRCEKVGTHCEVKDIPPYETPTTPPVCVETTTGTQCTYYYEKPKGEVIVRFLEENTNSILHTPINLPKENYGTNYDVSTNNNDVKTADTKVKETHNFTRVDGNTNGTIGSKTHIVTYYYSPKTNPVPNIPTEYKDEVCKGKDKCEIPDLAPQCTTSTELAACGVVDIPGYVPPTTPVKEGNKWVYYYTKKEGNVIVKYVDKATGKTITDDFNLRDKVDNDYNVTDKKKQTIGDYVYDSTTGKETGKVVEGNTIITHYYNKKQTPPPSNPPSTGPGGYVPPKDPTPPVAEKITEYRDKTTGEELLPQCKATEVCPVKDIPGYRFVETKNENGKTIHYYEKIKDGKVIIKYLDKETFNEIKIEDIITGKVGDYYNTVEYAKDDIVGYKLIGPADFDLDEIQGNIKSEDITVIYFYERVVIVPKVQKPKLPKTGADLEELGIENGRLIAQASDVKVVPMNEAVKTASDNVTTEPAEETKSSTENYMNYALIAIVAIAALAGFGFFINKRRNSEEE